MDKKLFNTKEASEYLGISDKTVSRAIKAGNIPVVVLNNRSYISRQVLDNMLAGGQ